MKSHAARRAMTIEMGLFSEHEDWPCCIAAGCSPNFVLKVNKFHFYFVSGYQKEFCFFQNATKLFQSVAFDFVFHILKQAVDYRIKLVRACRLQIMSKLEHFQLFRQRNSIGI